MTATLPEVTELAEPLLTGGLDDHDASTKQEPERETKEQEVRRGRVALAAGLSTMAAVWMTAHVFHSVATSTLVGALGVMIGAGGIFLAHQLRRPGLAPYAALPAGLVVGAIVTTVSSGGGNLTSLVSQTLHDGGLRNPPIPFDPGWRFLTVLLFTFISAAATSMAIGAARPKLAVALPCLVTVPVALLQPKGHELVATAGGAAFLVVALAVAYGADLANDVGAGVAFETRRLARGAVLLTLAVAALVGVAQTSFLFPATNQSTVIPPRKPPPSPPLPPEQLLFSVTAAASLPWRLGVLDSYGHGGFLLPSVDSSRLLAIKHGDLTLATSDPGKLFPATVTIRELHGQTLPAPAGLVALHGVHGAAGYDPESGLPQLRDVSVHSGLSYSVQASTPPSAAQLRSTGNHVDSALIRYTAAPPVPPGVGALLAKAPTNTSFDRLQFLRSTLLAKVIANGSGGASDIAPTQVDSMLNGGQATPFQIVAAQVLLARWGGIPARIGFGFYGGTSRNGVTDYHPIDGSAWLEADFGNYGWVPIIGTPQRATPSLSKAQKQKAAVKSSDQLALSLYIPVRELSVHLIYELVRYYAVRAVAIVVPLVLLVIGYPIGLKAWRRHRRRRWARREGPVGRVLVAYADFRDHCYDLNLGDPRATPLEFLTAIAADREHDELAWLVSRAVWGDLARDLREEDVTAVENMARSVTKRVSEAQPMINRSVAAVTRTSLRDPWSDELPNVWWSQRRADAARPALGRIRRLLLLRRPAVARAGGATP